MAKLKPCDSIIPRRRSAGCWMFPRAATTLGANVLLRPVLGRKPALKWKSEPLISAPEKPAGRNGSTFRSWRSGGHSPHQADPQKAGTALPPEEEIQGGHGLKTRLAGGAELAGAAIYRRGTEQGLGHRYHLYRYGELHSNAPGRIVPGS